MPRHKHADVIHAFAEGAGIQVKRDSGGVWADERNPSFLDFNEYRIKPRTVKHEGWVNIYNLYSVHATEEIAKKFSEKDDLVATVKIEWEEEE